MVFIMKKQDANKQYFHEKVESKDHLWDRFETIYFETFEEHERESVEKLYKNVLEGVNLIYLVIDQNGNDIGFYILYVSPSVRYSLLWYIGVREASQGAGVGTRILRGIKDNIAKDDSYDFLILEAEERQSKWYSKNGFEFCDVNYHYPSFTDDRLIFSHLMRVGYCSDSDHNIRDYLLKVVKDMYVNIYKLDVNSDKYSRLIKKLPVNYPPL